MSEDTKVERPMSTKELRFHQFEEWGEEEVRRRISIGRMAGQNLAFAQEWLSRFDEVKAEERYKESTSIANRATLAAEAAVAEARAANELSAAANEEARKANEEARRAREAARNANRIAMAALAIAAITLIVDNMALLEWIKGVILSLWAWIVTAIG